MAKFRSSPKTGDKPRRVWRISDDAPQGVWVDPAAPPAAPPAAAPLGSLPEVTSGGWVVSSFDLLHGTEISEGPDTVPDDLFDELFPGYVPAAGRPDRR